MADSTASPPEQSIDKARLTGALQRSLAGTTVERTATLIPLLRWAGRKACFIRHGALIFTGCHESTCWACFQVCLHCLPEVHEPNISTA